MPLATDGTAASPMPSFKRPPQRPQSASRSRPPPPSTTSLIQQKLQAALQTAERTGASLIHMQQSFRARGVASAAAALKEQGDRSISRYRNDAAIISFAETATVSAFATTFCYSSNFMPGVHFYTFLAAKDTATSAASTSATRPPSPERPAQATSGGGGNDEPQQPTTAKPPKKNPNGALRMWIPDTVVYGETGRAVWLYTDEDGYVQRTTEFTEKTVVEKLIPTTSTDLEPVVIWKEPIAKLATTKHHAPPPPGPLSGACSSSPSMDPSGGANGGANTCRSSSTTTPLTYQGNSLRVLSPGELKTVLSNVSSTRSTKSFALQRFIRCNGAKAFLVRAVYEANKPPYAWMVNNTATMQAPTPTVSQVLQSLGQDAAVSGGGSTASASAAAPVTTGGSSCLPTARSASVQSMGHSRNSVVTTATATASAADSDSTEAVVPLVNRLCTSIQVDKACTFIKLSERGCTTVAELNQRLVKYLEQRLHVQLQSLIADYVKDAEGKWWLLQVKHFRVRAANGTSLIHKPCVSLPRRLRMQYLGYRDSSLLEESTDSDDENDQACRVAQIAAQLAQRQVRKLLPCKCCLAAYPKDELAFKMTLKMINEMLVRVRARLSPDKKYSFLTAALARESSPDPSLAYESWSVCSYCYAIYERDQQLQKVETKFAEIVGTPDQGLVALGLGKLADRSHVIDPTSSTTVLPAQLTLCRLMLVVNGIYDIPPELYDAEKAPMESAVTSTSRTNRASTFSTSSSHRDQQSRLYLRISSLGYTECIPIDPKDIMITQERAPRGARRRRVSSVTSVPPTARRGKDGADDDADDRDDNSDDDYGDDPCDGDDDPGGSPRNYWLPIHLIRTVHFFAPRTPLHAKLKDTSGLTPFLNEDNSISIQFIRATEPPLNDLASGFVVAAGMEAKRSHNRRAALHPQRQASTKEGSTMAPSSVPPQRVGHTTRPTNQHSVLLGATKLRMAQFRSAYVTKLDFYACMALTGEMFNIKGNIGLERLRYVDTKLLTSQYRLRVYNGVYIPDESYMPSDPLSAEWMDCLRAAIHPHASRQPEDKPVSPFIPSGHESQATIGAAISPMRNSNPRMGHSTSTTSLSAGNEEMDEELELLIERRAKPSQGTTGTSGRIAGKPVNGAHAAGENARHASPASSSTTQSSRVTLPSNDPPSSRFEAQMNMLMHKPVLSPRSKPSPLEPLSIERHEPGVASSSATTGLASLSVGPARSLWSFVLQLNHVHNLQTRERPYCRWECYYELFGQRRSAVERTTPSTSMSSPSPALQASEEVAFNCTHRFFLSATMPALQNYLRANRTVALQLRNDVYASTRSQLTGEFGCVLDVARLLQSKSYDATLDIQPTGTLTPRDAASMARSPAYLSVSVQLSQMAVDPEEVVSNGDFVVVGSTGEGIHVLKKIV